MNINKSSLEVLICVERIPVRLNKGNVGRNNPKNQHRSGADQLESRSVGKDLGVFMDGKLVELKGNIFSKQGKVILEC